MALMTFSRVDVHTPGVPYVKTKTTPRFVKALLFLLISLLGLLGLQVLPTTVPQGWVPVVALLAALGLVATALFEVMRMP